MARDTCDTEFVDEERVERVRRKLPSEDDVERGCDMFKALADPSRVRILSALSQEELCVCDLAHLLGLSQSNVSHQLRLLRNLRMVRHRKDGRMAYYRIDDSHVPRLLDTTLEHVREAGT